MTVRNEQKLAFRDMTPEERSEIVEAWLKGDAEYLANATRWDACGTAFIATDSIYRTKQKQLVIPWEVIKPEYKWAAMDEDGEIYVFICKPEVHGNTYWHHESHMNIDALNINTTGIDWRESLTERPEGCDEKQY